MDNLTDEYQHIFMNIELNVVMVCRKYTELVDHNIDKVYEAVQRTLEKELQGKNPPKYRWKGHEEDLFEAVEGMTRVLLGEDSLVEYVKSDEDTTHDAEATVDDEVEDDDEADDDDDDEIEVETVPKEVMVKILKRLRSSVHTWTGSSAYGRRGYIDYISNFM
jgi:hypothetical protein